MWKENLELTHNSVLLPAATINMSLNGYGDACVPHHGPSSYTYFCITIFLFNKLSLLLGSYRADYLSVILALCIHLFWWYWG